MSDERVCAMTPEMRKREKRKMYFANIKYQFNMKAHAYFWRFLWFTKLARHYSKFTCAHGLYRKFSDGRCMYCGLSHK